MFPLRGLRLTSLAFGVRGHGLNELSAGGYEELQAVMSPMPIRTVSLPQFSHFIFKHKQHKDTFAL